MMLFYLPLEQYPERYTALMSCRGGWAESWFDTLGVPFIRVDGTQTAGEIRSGVVLDAVGRSYYATTQIAALIAMIQDGTVKDGDFIYTEDFWQPGIETLFYIRDIAGVDFKIGCFCHAQSVDDTDFSYALRRWMRPIEQGYGRGYDHIIVCSEILKNLLIAAGIGTAETVHVTGLPFNGECLDRQLTAMGDAYRPGPQEDYVIFTSRFDAEKDPMFFLDLVERCPDINFRLVNPRAGRTISNDPNAVERLNRVLARPDNNLRLISTSDKAAYYTALSRARVQFNCANQDWVSWTLVEASYFGCTPLYPKWKDFPSELHNDPRVLYEKGNLDDCETHLRALLAGDPVECPFVWEKHNRTWERNLRIFGLLNQ